MEGPLGTKLRMHPHQGRDKLACYNATEEYSVANKRGRWMERTSIGWKLIFIIGVILFGMALYFLFIRPVFVLLPEDGRLTGFSGETLKAQYPEMFRWIGYVFRSWGAFILGSSIMVMSLSYNGLRCRQKWAWHTLAIAGIPMLSIFTVVNIALKGDFVWLIGGMLILLFVGLYLTRSVSTKSTVARSSKKSLRRA